jgi:methylated-DNA-[protein]-cysteine S-methyltransferase
LTFSADRVIGKPGYEGNIMNSIVGKGLHTTRLFHCSRKTRFGPVALLWSVHEGHPRICRVLLSRPGCSALQVVESLFPGSISFSSQGIDVVADQIVAFFVGKDILFSLDVVRMDLCSTFQQSVLRAEHAVPRGAVSTYQRIAKYLGNARSARAVGTALAHNPFPIVIPCHRAIRSDRTLGGFQGGVGMKKALLEMEGVMVDGSGRVVSGQVFY